jgi:Mg/Co/Ni transporter MgtE
VLDLMPAPQRTKVITLMGFNPDSAGGLMNVDFVSCGPAATAGEALAIIGAARTVQPEALLKMHILDEDKQLAGVVSVIALLQAEPSENVAALMDSDPVRVTADADLTDVALLMADYNLYAIPIVDDEDRVLGVVTVDDVLEATIPEDWRRREPAPRPMRDSAEGTATDDNDATPSTD